MLHSPLPRPSPALSSQLSVSIWRPLPNLKLNRTYFLLVFALVCNSRTEVCLLLCVCVCVCRPLVMSLSVIVMQTMPGRRQQAGRQAVVVNLLLLPPGGVLPLFGSCISFTFSMSLRSFSLSLSLADIRNLPLQINCQVMAVTSLLPPPSLSPSLLCSRSFSLLTRVSMR